MVWQAKTDGATALFFAAQEGNAAVVQPLPFSI